MIRRYTPDRLPLLRHPLLIGLGLILIFGSVQILTRATPVFFLGFVAILIANLMSFPVSWLSRWIPRGLATVLTLFGLVGILSGAIFFATPRLVTETRTLLQQVPQALERAQNWYVRVKKQGSMAQLPASPTRLEQSLRNRFTEQMGNFFSGVLPAALNLGEGLLTTALILILAAFLLHQPDTYREGVIRLLPTGYDALFDEAWLRVGSGLRHWIGGILVSMSIMGAFTALGLALVGIESWPMLAMLTFFGTFVPYLGAICSAVPGLLVGLAKSPNTFVYTLLIYIGVHILEGYIVQPLVMKRAVELRPGLLLFWQALMGAAFGIMGIIIATPMLVCVKILIGYLYIEQKLEKTEKPESSRSTSPAA